MYKADYLCTPVALKIYDNLDKASLHAFIGELEAYYKAPVYLGNNHVAQPASYLQHPNIVQVVGAYQKNNKSYLVTELSEYGTINQFISAYKNLQKTQGFRVKLKACIQVAQALAYLHSHAQLYHRDLKAENVLVFSYGQEKENIHIKLCDFGVSKRFEPVPQTGQTASSPPSMDLEQLSGRPDRTQTLGTIPWMAPEFLEHRIFTEKSDIYSFGILLYEIFNPEIGKPGANLSPYPDLQLVQISYQVINE